MSEASRSALLTAYDEQLRGEPETRRATWSDVDGPVFRSRFGDQRGFVSHRTLDGLSSDDVDALIARAVAYFRDQTSVDSFEWKTRGHDQPADFPARLVAQGFVPEECETVMIGEAHLVADAPVLPGGVDIRQVGAGLDPQASRDVIIEDLERMFAMQVEVFGREAHQDAGEFADRMAEYPDQVEAWIAENSGQVICTGRLEVVEGTQFASLWGGATRRDWRRMGIYRGLTAARARSAMAKGITYLHSDSTDGSRPILARSGFTAVTTTTPYIWHRPSLAL